MKFKRIAIIVLDSVGIGELPDAKEYGDLGTHTLGHLVQTVPNVQLPNLRSLGLANIVSIADWQPVNRPSAYFGKMAEVSAGKDTMTGHWELMGLKIETPFRTFSDGFPEELISAFAKETGRDVLGNKAASGTEILKELGEQQMKSGAWIVYTSADSVFQVAAHEEVIPLEELYAACRIARRLTRKDEFSVGRVIARPYRGKPGAFTRTPNRHDYALKPPKPTVLNALKNAGFEVVSVGKINDIFDGEGITRSFPTKSNRHGIETTLQRLAEPFQGLLFTNLVDFDSLYGHRRDPEGYARALEEFDRAVPSLQSTLGESDMLIITADHGNDPTHSGTDHTREYVPLLTCSPAFETPGGLGTLPTYSDLAATIADNFKLPFATHGQSFLQSLK